MGMNDSISTAVRKDAPAIFLEDTLRTAIHRMTETRSSSLVVKNGLEVVGIVSITDLITSVANNQDLDGTGISRFMTSCRLTDKGATQSPCIQVAENETVKTALMIMEKAGVHNLLVADANGQTIGMASAGDLLKLAIS
jgi:CBS domain-containing protein